MPAPRISTLRDLPVTVGAGRAARAATGSSPSPIAARYTAVEPPRLPAACRKSRRETVRFMATSEAEVELAVVVSPVDAERRERGITGHHAIVAGGELRSPQRVVALVRLLVE